MRAFDVRLKPGEKVIEDRTVKSGTAVWSEASMHAAENIGTTEFREVQIELKKVDR